MKCPRHIRFLLFFLLLAVCSLMGSRGGQAQSYGDSTDEEVAIAFFHTADTNPDFDKWARGTKAFKRIAPARVEDYLYEEKQRLMRLWKRYNADINLINIRMDVVVDLKSTTNKDGSETFSMRFVYDYGPPSFFPYNFQDYKFAVIPQKLETMIEHPLDKIQYELMRREFDNKPSGHAALYLQLKAVKAYIQQPYKVENEERWVMLTDIANMALKSNRTDTNFWAYTAPWYVSPITEELRNMYGGAGSEGIEPVRKPAMIR